MIWHLFAQEKPQANKRIVVRDKNERPFGQDNDRPLVYDGNSFRSPLAVSHFGVDMNNIVYWGYYEDMYK